MVHKPTVPLKAGPDSFKRLLGSRPNKIQTKIRVIQPSKPPLPLKGQEIRPKSRERHQECLQRIHTSRPVLQRCVRTRNAPGAIPVTVRWIRKRSWSTNLDNDWLPFVPQ